MEAAAVAAGTNPARCRLVNRIRMLSRPFHSLKSGELLEL
jgi:hypothetical protein